MNDLHEGPPVSAAASALAPGVVDDISDMLTIIMGNLELLSRQPLAPCATRQLARASLAARRAGGLLKGRVPPRGVCAGTSLP